MMTDAAIKNPRILMVYRALLGQTLDEASEVRQYIAGLITSSPVPLRVWATDCRNLYEAHLSGDGVEYSLVSSWSSVLTNRFDVAHIHTSVQLDHMIFATLLKLRGTKIVLSPLSMLSDDFARSSWFRSSSRLFRSAKPLLVQMQRFYWSLITDLFVCFSDEEIRVSHLPKARCALLPWTIPKTPMVQAIIDAASDGSSDGNAHAGPVAFVSFSGDWRKGSDRLVRWASAYEQRLPRPALKLFCASFDESPEIKRLIESGVVEWDKETKGVELFPKLKECRGMILLSRFEGQPRVLREAALMGLPIISTPSCHFDEVTKLLGEGAVVDGDDVDAVQAAFERVATAPRDRERAWMLFEKKLVGAFLLALLTSIAQGAKPRERSFYSFIMQTDKTKESCRFDSC